MKTNPSEFIPTMRSEDNEWITWHKSLKSTFGKNTANQVFLKAWNARKSSTANTHELRDYLDSQGITIETNLLGKVTDTAGGIGDSIGDFLKIGKYALYAVGGIIILSLGMLLINVARKPAEIIGSATQGAAKGIRGGV